MGLAMRRLVVLGALAMAVSACAPTGSLASPPASAAEATPIGELGTDIANRADGPFELVLALPGSTFSTDQAVTGQAVLSVADGKEAMIAGPGAGPLAFSFREVGGTRQMEAGYRPSCRMFTIESGAPITSDLTKSGGWPANDPNASFYQSFFADPDIHLPSGTWDISARAWFSENRCNGPSHDMTATVRVVVSP